MLQFASLVFMRGWIACRGFIRKAEKSSGKVGPSPRASSSNFARVACWLLSVVIFHKRPSSCAPLCVHFCGSPQSCRGGPAEGVPKQQYMEFKRIFEISKWHDQQFVPCQCCFAVIASLSLRVRYNCSFACLRPRLLPCVDLPSGQGNGGTSLGSTTNDNNITYY